MQAIKALTQSQRVSRALAAQQVVAITFAMNAMVQRHPPQLKMPRLDAYCAVEPRRKRNVAVSSRSSSSSR